MTTPEDRAERLINAILVHGFENDAEAERVLREQQAGVARLLAHMDVEAYRAKFPGVSAAFDLRPGGVNSPEIVTAYTVAAEANARIDAQDVLVRADEIKTWLDDTVKVGTHEGRTMVFNKRDAAAKIAQIVNDRFNARKAK